MTNEITASSVQTQVTYVDRVEVPEIFAHSMKRLTFDGYNLHIEFVVNRMGEPDANGNVATSQSVTAARVVIPLPGGMELQAHLGALMQSLHAQGVIKPTAPVPQVMH